MQGRLTSLEAYNEIKRTGALSRTRFLVYEVLVNHGPLTGGEVSNILKEVKAKTSESIRNRLTELRDMGVIYELGTKK